MRLFALVLAAAAAFSAATAFADPVEGVWQTQPDNTGGFGHVKIAPCGAMICGILIRAFGADGQPRPSDRIGTQILWDMEAAGDGRYAGGKIFSPDLKNTYRSKMVLSGDRLKVSGCVGPICRGQTWARIN